MSNIRKLLQRVLIDNSKLLTSLAALVVLGGLVKYLPLVGTDITLRYQINDSTVPPVVAELLGNLAEVKRDVLFFDGDNLDSISALLKHFEKQLYEPDSDASMQDAALNAAQMRSFIEILDILPSVLPVLENEMIDDLARDLQNIQKLRIDIINNTNETITRITMRANPIYGLRNIVASGTFLSFVGKEKIEKDTMGNYRDSTVLIDILDLPPRSSIQLDIYGAGMLY